MTLPAKFIGGYSGLVVESFGYPMFFVYVSALGIPAILAVAYLLKTSNTRPSLKAKAT
jgi:PAT family beta-lactamase induction signal transducer AmpG